MPGLVIQQVPGGAVKIVQGTTTQVVTAGLAQTSAGTFSPPSGTGFIHITGGAMDGAARNPLASEVPGFDNVTVSGVPANTWLVQASSATAAAWVNPSTVTVGAAAAVTAGTAGQVYITNSGPSAVWTSLISVELTHGNFKAGGSGSDYYTRIGALTGQETVYGAMWMLGAAITPTALNPVMYSDGVSTYINAPFGTGNIGFTLNGSSYIALMSAASSRFYLGGSSSANAITFDWATAGVEQLFTSGATNQFLIATNKAGAFIRFSPDAATTLVDLYGGSQTVNLFGTPTAFALGSVLATTGHIRMPSTWAMTARNAANTANLNIISLDASNNLTIGADLGGAGSVTLGPGASGGYAQLFGNPVYIQSFNGGGSCILTVQNMAYNWGAALGGFVSFDVNNMAFHNLAGTPILWQYAAATDVATVPLTIRAQYAYALATGTHQIPGSLVFDIGAPTNGGTTEAAFKFTRNGGSAFAGFGVQNSIPTFGHLWLGTTAAASTNWALRSDASGSCYLNAEAGGATGLITGGSTFQLYIVGGVAYFGGSTAAAPLTHDWTTTTTPKMQSGTSATTLTIGTNKAGAVLGLQADAGTSVVSCDSAAVRIINVNFRVANSSQFGSLTESLGGGSGVIGIKDASVSPSSNPSGGGVLYSEAGALKWRGSSGSITTIATA